MTSMFSFSVLLTVCSTLFGNIQALPTGEVTEGNTNAGFFQFDVQARNFTDGVVGDKRDLSRFTAPISNQQVKYMIDLYVGSNKQKNTVQVDTGSSDTWFYDSSNSGVFDDGTYNPSESTTSKNTNETFNARYDNSYSAQGYYYLDDVTLPGGQVLPQFQFGDATSGAAPSGILGVGSNKTEQTGNTYPTFVTSLKYAGYIAKAAFSLYLNSSSVSGGSLIFGGIDTAKYSGDIHYGEVPLDYIISLPLDSITVNGSALPINVTFGFDSGFAHTQWPDNVVEILGATLVGARKTYGWWANCDQPDKYISLNFGATSIQVPYSAFVAGGGGLCQIISAGSDVVTFGDDILRYFYVVYNFDDNTMGVAQSVYTSESNIIPIT